MNDLPYYRVVRLNTGRWAVVHRVPGTGVDHPDIEIAKLKAAQEVCAGMNQQRECGWQIANVYAEANT